MSTPGHAEKRPDKSSKIEASDPTDDKTYEGVSLEDFIRHFIPQALEQQKEIAELNEKKFSPFPDPLFPETMPATTTSRREKRNQVLKKRKAEKKRQTVARQAARNKKGN